MNWFPSFKFKIDSALKFKLYRYFYAFILLVFIVISMFCVLKMIFDPDSYTTNTFKNDLFIPVDSRLQDPNSLELTDEEEVDLNFQAMAKKNENSNEEEVAVDVEYRFYKDKPELN